METLLVKPSGITKIFNPLYYASTTLKIEPYKRNYLLKFKRGLILKSETVINSKDIASIKYEQNSIVDFLFNMCTLIIETYGFDSDAGIKMFYVSKNKAKRIIQLLKGET